MLTTILLGSAWATSSLQTDPNGSEKPVVVSQKSTQSISKQNGGVLIENNWDTTVSFGSNAGSGKPGTGPDYGSKPINLTTDFPATICPPSSQLDNDPELHKRRSLIRNMTLEAWNAYVFHAWGSTFLFPQNKTGHSKSGQTIIDALSTLWIMNANDEFSKAKDYVLNEFTLKPAKEHFIPEVHSALLSAYALTGDKAFLAKELELAKMAPKPGK